MSTLTPSHNEPATVQSSRGFRIGDAMNYQAWIAKAAKHSEVTGEGEPPTLRAWVS